ncbi:hypothetical protein VTJ04DRAFT_7134 [Mycothermus thermophilus]|uniref:uncharacterized protein n=1 Tax=Humicola insolens TaxID=85995 RepID=UPI003744088A
MDSNPAKRRKLDHGADDAELALAAAAAASAGLTSRSATFVLETEELLDSVCPDYESAFSGADELLHRIKGLIEGIEAHDQLQIADAAARLEKKHKIKVPFPDPRPNESSNYKVAFAPPSRFNVVGSYVFKTMVKTQKNPAIDMVLVIPESILQEKDYLDMRYFYKRAYYLAVVAASLRKDLANQGQLSYEYLHGNPLCPVLVFQPNRPAAESESQSNKTQDFRIRILPSAPEGFFPAAKLHLGASLLRKVREGDSESEPTPFYNSTLTAEATYFPYLKVLRQAEKKSKAFRKACVLGRIWLQQRGFGSDVAHGGFGQFEWALVLALLLQGGGEKKGQAALSASLSSTQLFKAMIQFLSVTNFSEKAYVFGSTKVDLDSHLESGPVLYDAARQLNIAFKMGSWSAALLHQHAKWTRALLAENTDDQFTPTFILKADVPVHSFDFIAHLDPQKVPEQAGLDSRGPTWRLGSKLYRVLKRALADKEMGERARVIHVRTPGYTSWALTESSKPETAPLEIGVLFDPLRMARTVDRGPVAGPSAEQQQECAKFRKFWGEKAELRRFEGDEARETLVWSSTTPFDLCEEIVRYILGRHLKVGKQLTVYGGRLPSLLSLKPADTAVFNVARKAFGVFERDIRDLDDLPLRVRQVAPVCPELRHASVGLPVLDPSKSWRRPLECVISFEASGKWPESIIAIQRTKIAFLIMIGSLLEKNKPGEVRTHVGLEDSAYDDENLAFLDVIYENGPAFRLRIHSDLEESLLLRQSKNKMTEQWKRQRAATLLATFKRLYVNLPLHNQYMTTCATRFPALSPTTRLVKHWFNAHKLSCHFTDEFLELATLRVFLSPHPWEPPTSAATGFLRVLAFLAHWDWRSEPLILDTSGEMTTAERAQIATRLDAWRKIDTHMNHTVLFVATAQEQSGVAWTSLDGHPKPPKVAAARMTSLAKTASKLIKEQGVKLDVRTLFVPSLKEYDVLIHLNKKVVKSTLTTYPDDDPTNPGNNDVDGTSVAKFKNLAPHAGQDPLPLAQHPVDALFKRLEATYSNGGGPLLFFRSSPASSSDSHDGVIGAVWNPRMLARPFRVSLPTAYKPASAASIAAANAAKATAAKAKKDAAAAGVAGMNGLKRKAPAGDEERDGESGSDDDEEMEEVEEGEETMVEVDRDAILAEIARIGGEVVERIEVRGSSS